MSHGHPVVGAHVAEMKRVRQQHPWICLLTAVWPGAAAFGLRAMQAYDNAPGAPAYRGSAPAP